MALPDFISKFSPKTYTQPQLFACLVLKEFLQRDYRGIEALLRDSPSLLKAIDLEKTPDELLDGVIGDHGRLAHNDPVMPL